MKFFGNVQKNSFRVEFGITISNFIFTSISPGLVMRVYFWKYLLNFGVYTDKKEDNL
jgi:hypothetical protein